MLTLILMVLFGLAIAYFALQNTGVTHVTFFNYPISGVPMYLVVIISMLFGIFVSWIISLVDAVSTTFVLRGRESALKGAQRTIEDLKEKAHKLEIENASLKGEQKEPIVVEEKVHESYRPSPWERIKAQFRQSRFRQAV